MQMAMICTTDGEWDDITVADAEKLVSEGKAGRVEPVDWLLPPINYDDGLPSYQLYDSEDDADARDKASFEGRCKTCSCDLHDGECPEGCVQEAE